MPTTPSASRPLEALESIALGSVAMTARAVDRAGVELTFPQWRVLVVVGERAEGSTVSEIADRLTAALSPVSRLIARMERRALLVTAKDAGDRRVTRVSLSAAGRRLRDEVLAARRAEIEDALAAAPALDANGPALDLLTRLGRSFLARA